jgi:hypothetical protein
VKLWDDPEDWIGRYEPGWSKFLFVGELAVLVGIGVVRWTGAPRLFLPWIPHAVMAWVVCFFGSGLVVMAIAARRRHDDRKRAARICPTCGYDLRATPERCPECGTSTDAEGS